MVWGGMVWYDMVWYGMGWFEMVLGGFVPIGFEGGAVAWRGVA